MCRTGKNSSRRVIAFLTLVKKSTACEELLWQESEKCSQPYMLALSDRWISPDSETLFKCFSHSLIDLATFSMKSLKTCDRAADITPNENVQKAPHAVSVSLWHLIKRRFCLYRNGVSHKLEADESAGAQHKLDFSFRALEIHARMQCAIFDSNLHLIPPNELLSCLSSKVVNEKYFCATIFLRHVDGFRARALNWSSLEPKRPGLCRVCQSRRKMINS